MYNNIFTICSIQQIPMIVEKTFVTLQLRPFGQLNKFQIVTYVQALDRFISFANWIPWDRIHAVDLRAVRIASCRKLCPNAHGALNVPILPTILGQTTGQKTTELVGQLVGMANSLDASSEAHQTIGEYDFFRVEIVAIEINRSTASISMSGTYHAQGRKNKVV